MGGVAGGGMSPEGNGVIALTKIGGKEGYNVDHLGGE